MDKRHETILVVDDSAPTVELIRRNLEGRDFRVYCASSVGEAVELLETTAVDLVVTDIKMPRVSGHDLVRHVRQNFESTEVIVVTGYPTVEGAVEAMKGGAEEYVVKPFTEEELFDAVGRALDKLAARLAAKAPPLPEAPSPGGLIGCSQVMQAVFRSISKAAKANATVLITGESGTGKELVARAIHYGGPRSQAPFVPVNCGGIPTTLLESELFGYVKGSFTGASESRAGFFLTADGGTIFLDEIGDTGLEMQVKLLRVLQDKQVVMVGGRRGRTVDVRVVAATNKDLFAMTRRATFREDLYFRLNVIAIEVPPLRMRGDDLLLLLSHFLSKHASELDRPIPSLTDEAVGALRGYGWPGNVRELENVVQRLVVMSEGDVIDASDLPQHLRFSAVASCEVQRSLAEVEAVHIRNVMASVDGNKSRAASILGIDRKTLRDKLKRYGLTP